MTRMQSRILVAVWMMMLGASSCTCHREPPPPAPAPRVEERRPAFTLAARPTHTLQPPTPPPSPATPAAKGTTSPQPGVALPTDWPSDVPVFSGASLAAVQQLGGGAHNVLFTVEAPASEIFDFYKSDLRNAGHEVTQEYQTAEQSFISFKKGNFVTNIVIASDPNDRSRRVIAVMYQEEEEIEEF